VRKIFRNFVIILSIFITFPLWAPAKVCLAFGNENVFVSFGQLLSLIPGSVGNMLRRGYFILCLEHVAWDCGIGFGTWFSHAAIKVEPGVSIGAHCLIGMCHISKNTLIGSNVDILSGRRQHNFCNREINISKQRGTFQAIKIGSDCWIGNSAVVMADVGNHCVVGAGSVVVKPVPNNSVSVGNPAKIMQR